MTARKPNNLFFRNHETLALSGNWPWGAVGATHGVCLVFHFRPESQFVAAHRTAARSAHGEGGGVGVTRDLVDRLNRDLNRLEDVEGRARALDPAAGVRDHHVVEAGVLEEIPQAQ